jgi:hypothetical protein
MNEEKEGDYTNPKDKGLKAFSIPGLRTLADNIGAASGNGALFCLAEAVDSLLADHLKKRGTLPNSLELEAIIVRAAQTIAGK